VALVFQIKLEFRNVDILRREKNQRTHRKTLGARVRTNNKLNPLYDVRSGPLCHPCSPAPLLSFTDYMIVS